MYYLCIVAKKKYKNRHTRRHFAIYKYCGGKNIIYLLKLLMSRKLHIYLIGMGKGFDVATRLLK